MGFDCLIPAGSLGNPSLTRTSAICKFYCIYYLFLFFLTKTVRTRKEHTCSNLNLPT